MNKEAARALKARGCWGEQNGLLSVSEMVLLDEYAARHERILEVGHYHGLSTACLCGGAMVVTVDSHAGDACVPVPAGKEAFLSHAWGDNVIPMFMDSRGIQAPLMFPMVFYDGDHQDEQMRFTKVVHESPRVRLFVFDDCDFPVPAACRAWLLEHGWRDESPETVRLHGDKTNEETMTLAVLTR